MPFAQRIAAGSMIFGTLLAAAGLNLGVLGHTRGQTPTTDDVVLQAASPAAAPEQPPAAAVEAVASSTTDAEGPAPSSSAPGSTSSPTAPTSTTSIDTTTTVTTPRPAATQPSATRPEPRPTDVEPSSTTVAAVPPASTEFLTYEFVNIASIIVALHDGNRLEFWSAIPEDGWAFRVDDDEDHKVKIKFRPIDGGDEAEFELELEDGELEIKQEY